jgi:hypothetical protein
MSNRRKPHRPRPRRTGAVRAHDDAPAAPEGVVTMRSPADVIAMVPYLLGFELDESIVIVSLGGSRQRVGPIVRADLGGPGGLLDPALMADYLASVAGSRGYDAVLVVAYSTQREAADTAVAAVMARLAETGVRVREALRADGRRWWSYTCERECCPPAGTPYDPSTTAAAALAVTMGLSKEPSRDALARQFARLGPAERCAIGAEARGVHLSRRRQGVDSRRLEDVVEASLASEAVARESLGLLLGAVQDLEARDVAWALMTRTSADRHFALWRDVMRAADDDLLPPAGALCAFAAWLSGQGAVAATAAEQVAAVRPDYPFLGLVAEIMARGISPDHWEAYRRTLAQIAGLVSEEQGTAGGEADDAAG